jgi:hypothetical protein
MDFFLLYNHKLYCLANSIRRPARNSVRIHSIANVNKGNVGIPARRRMVGKGLHTYNFDTNAGNGAKPREVCF